MPQPPAGLRRSRLSRRGLLPGSQAACRTGGTSPQPALKPVTLLMVNWGDISQGWRDLGARFTERYPRLTVEFSITAGRRGSISRRWR